MFKPRVKSPVLCLFWAFPLLLALGIDIWIWQMDGGQGFHFSDFGYLLQHYKPDAHDTLVSAIDHPLYRQLLQIIFTTKTVILGGLIAGIAVLIINRPRRGSNLKSFRHTRR